MLKPDKLSVYQACPPERSVAGLKIRLSTFTHYDNA